MDNQIAQSKISTQRIIIIAMAIVLAIAVGIVGIHMCQLSDPYIKEVLSLKGDAVKGNAIFLNNCAACHGSHADGFVGPSLHDVPKRKSKIGLIHQVISGKTPPMPKFQPSPQTMADLLSYLEQL